MFSFHSQAIMPKRRATSQLTYPKTIKKHAHELNLRFKHPARILISGPSNSGKTTLITEIFKRGKEFFQWPVTKIVFRYGSWQPAYDYLKKMGVEFKEGLPESIEEDFPQKTPKNEVRILVLDDQMDPAVRDFNILRLFTEKSHHWGVTAIMTSQNPYHWTKNWIYRSFELE